VRESRFNERGCRVDVPSLAKVEAGVSRPAAFPLQRSSGFADFTKSAPVGYGQASGVPACPGSRIPRAWDRKSMESG